MKKSLLLLMLMPLCALAQSTIAVWNNSSAPTGTNSHANVTPSAMSSAGISISGDTNQNQWEAFGIYLANLHTGSSSTSLMSSRYLEFIVKPNTNYRFVPSQFSFSYLSPSDSGAKKLQAQWSTNGTTWTNLSNAAIANQTEIDLIQGSQSIVTLNFTSGINVLPTQELKVRIYFYDLVNNYYSKFFLRTSTYSNADGPKLSGMVTLAGGVVANNNTISTLQNSAVNVNVLANDTATATTFGTVTIDTPPSASTGTAVVQTDKTITFTPANNYTGTTSFKYKVTGADGSMSTAFVYVTVNPFTAPTAGNITASATENASVTINVLGSVTMGSSNTVSQLTASAPAHGITTITADNKVTYTPVTGYYGADSFTYTVKDSNNKTATATVNVTVTELTRPVANNDTATTGQNIAITINALGNDTAGAGTINGISITGQPANGTAAVNGSNSIVYTPASGFTGTNTITYKITDSNGKFATATITVTVQAIIAASASNDTATTAKNTPITLEVLSNDTVGNSALTTLAVTTQPLHGSVTVNGNNTITYTPANNYTGNDSFKYKITNAYGTSSTATVSLQVVHPTATGALCGTYVISAVPQADYPQFATISAAVTHLNENGVTCPVTFLLKDDLYNNASGEVFPIVINTIGGSSVTNTVTFKPAPYKNVRVEAFRDAATGSWNATPAVFKLNGTDNVIFDGSNTTNGTTRNLTIVNSSYVQSGGASDYADRTVIWLATPDSNNGCENISVKYTGIKQTYKNTADNFCVGIYAGNGSVSGNNEITTGESYTAHKNIRVTGNDFQNVKQGVYINGNSGAPSQNIYVHNNDLGSENNTETIIQPCAMRHVNGFEFTENLIYRLYRDTAAASLVSSGIYVSGNSQNGLIAKNEMKGLTKTLDEGIWFAGIVLESDIQGNNNIAVINNFILNVAGNNATNYKGNGHGIIIVKGTGYKIYHNTVALNASQTGSSKGYSAALYVESGSALDVRNNIFVNNQTNTETRRTAIAVKAHYSSMSTVFTHLDYNSLFSTDKLAFVANQWGIGDIESWGSPDYVTTLSAWQSISGKDTHSVNFNPIFASATDLHLTEGNSAIDNEGTPLAAVTKDIDGQLRNTTKPTIGADEYGDAEPPVTGGEGNPGIYCTTSTKYQNGVWSNGEPTAEKDAIFASDYTQTGGTLYVCSLYVIGNAKVNFISHSNAVVTHAVNVASTGSLTFESGSSLRQIENTANTGNVVIKRNSSSLKRLDYTLWSSPVKNQKLLPFSPATMTDRFYNYNTPTDQYVAVNASIVATTNFTAAKAYLIRMPNSHATTGYNAGTTAIIYPGKFTGTPHNGTVRIPLVYGTYTNGAADANGTLKQYNGVGNPYASPINITDFLTENADAIDGTIYFWRKTNDPTKTSYWTCNKSGATANDAPGGVNDLVQYPHSIDPTGLINTGQGFIVKALAPNREVVFKNNMRRSETYDTFFRAPNQGTGTQQSAPGIPNLSRVWINVENSAGRFAQTLVGYSDITTAGYDNGYDGDALLDGGVSIYSIMPEHKLAIQTRAAFTDADVVPLGFKTTVEGNFEMKADQLDGLFAEGQAVYLKDKAMNALHNLSAGNYSFTSEIGTFENRFEIVYTTDGTLGTDVPQVADKDVIIYKNERQVKIQAPAAIASLEIYDITGKVLFQKNNIGADAFSTSDLNTAQQMIVVKVTLEGGQAVSKKIMMN